MDWSCRTHPLTNAVAPEPSVPLLLRLDLLHERDAGMVRAWRADTRHAVAAEIFLVGLFPGLDVHPAIAMDAGKRVGLEGARAHLLAPDAVHVDLLLHRGCDE